MNDNLQPKHADEEACGKMWEIYVQEAQLYDEGLVRSWKEDMDVTLVFSGLYSAILTAFVIESYQNLQEDPAETSANILKQISSQISALPGTGNLTQEPLKPFDPTTSALVCNILWFASLSLALLCALLAMFVQQWARKFLHRTTMIRSPSTKAHLFQFLYFGVRDLGVHAIVDAIPSFLHLSIFLFFAGLSAFLVDVNIVLVYMTGVILFVILFLYILFTILPVITLRSFYQTPFSPVIWRLYQSPSIRHALKSARDIFTSRREPAFDPEGPNTHEAASSDPTAVEAPSGLQSTKPLSSLQDAMLAACRKPNHPRELQSLMWTMKSINDDIELLPFIEALIHTLWGQDGPRTGNYYLIRPFLETNDTHLNIIKRASSLLKNAQNTWLDDKHRKQCGIVCSKFFWILASIFLESPDTFTFPEIPGTGAQSIVWLPYETIEDLARLSSDEDVDTRHYASSAATLCALSIYVEVKTKLEKAPLYVQLKPLTGWSPIDKKLADQTRKSMLMQRFPAYEAREFVPALGVLCAQEVGRYLEGAILSLPHQFDQTADYIRRYADSMFLDVSSVLDQVTNQLERYPPMVNHLREFSKGTPSAVLQLDRVFEVICSSSHTKHAFGVVRYITKRVSMGGWTTTKKIWQAERALNRFYDLIEETNLVRWNDDYFTAFNEVFKCTVTVGFSDRGLRFWEFYLQLLRRHIDANGTQSPLGAQIGPVATSLRHRIMFYCLDYYSNDALNSNSIKALISEHLPFYAAKHDQLRIFSQEYIDKDSTQLYSVFLMLTLMDSDLKRSADEFRDILSFYLRPGTSHTIGFRNRVFTLPRVLRQFIGQTRLLVDAWIEFEGPSLVEHHDALLAVWVVWHFLLRSPELSLESRPEYDDLIEVARMVLRPESRNLITQLKGRRDESHERDPFPHWDLEKLVRGVISGGPYK